ncbi:MAG: hypothetical protein COX49_00850 [bacterium (Candidatus Stahlbacteria) CG23_combo_of_CG06-09_8_20_14_all_40_9]|nr:MAG: hypothetical protein COX49_00850 [bacterium (Candidatus Stahlbacteria) CG23_combo_of_CG06-09_8_20_14_all_40_9]
MNVLEIKRLIQTRESETVEFKTSPSHWKAVIETISAFANTKGGIVLIGVQDNGEIRGVKVGKDSIERFTNKIIQNTDPKIYPSIEVAKVDGKEIIVLTVKNIQNKPYLALGKAFKRVGKSTHQMSRDEYERMSLEKHKEELRFDEQICKGVTLEGIDKKRVKWYLEKRAEQREIKIPKTSFDEMVINLGISTREGNKITNAGIMFFGKDPQKFIPYGEVKIARFKGTSMTEFIDRKELQGALPELIDEAEKFVKRNTRMATKIVGFEQVNITEYPYEAVREAITNAVCHRDYFFSGASIRVMIFDDRIVVESPGILPEGVTLKNLEGSHVLRNQRIANWLYDIGYIEKWGTGIRRMKDLMREHGLETPKFEESERFFKVTFFGPREKILDLIKPKNRIDLKEKGLNSRQIEALKLMVNEKRKLTNREYRKLFNVSKPTATRDLTQLVKENLIREIGKGRGLSYMRVLE